MLPTQASSFFDMYSGGLLIFYILFALANGFLLYYASIKFLLVLQLSGYKGKRYFKWLANPVTPYLSRLMLLCLLGALFFCVLGVCFAPVFQAFFGESGKTVAGLFGFFAYVFFTVVYINTESSVNAKVPLKKTKRLVRLCITDVLLCSVFTFGLMMLLNYVAFLIGDEMTAIMRFAPVCIMPLASPYLLYLANLINSPVEKVIARHYVRIATEKLNKADVVKIGITGSYGKTSVKEILNTILSQRYRVLATPRSYNTPMGISLTVKKLDNTYDVFIAEMGARHKGDIKELVNIVKPKYAVLTGINSQHLESFGSIEGIIATKHEILEGSPEAAFFSTDNEYTNEMFNSYTGEKFGAGISGGEVYASDVKTDRTGTTFTLNVKGEAPVVCTTVLLGKHSISNVCLAAAVAKKMGMTAEEIAQGINRLQTVKHRLELVPNNKGIVIIDDSYNSNIAGIKSAIEVFDMFEGRKIVLTPGLVELGKIENAENFKFGKLLAEHADVVIIVGKHNAEALIAGLTEGGMDKSNIKFSKNTKRGNDELNEIIKEGDVVLFENDLPDNYS
ncbi:MAG: UDP-N-acetylmuramoyl-tripeptide--D-alanyl-D-alanine ligase [Clostridia bacterium]|nr:UDP-N-acetylmuramoyl-tripeptide--D-alanyl-D-alanine ligase [Clostridia bacterium]